MHLQASVCQFQERGVYKLFLQDDLIVSGDSRDPDLDRERNLFSSCLPLAKRIQNVSSSYFRLAVCLNGSLKGSCHPKSSRSKSLPVYHLNAREVYKLHTRFKLSRVTLGV